MSISQDKIKEIMDGIENRVRHAYNCGYSDGIEDTVAKYTKDLMDRVTAGLLAELRGEGNEKGLYIKVYADSEPQEKAEKLYQICEDISELAEVSRYLKDYAEVP